MLETKNTLNFITQGVYVISVKNGLTENAFTAAWVMQVSFQPLLICFSINPKHYSYQLLQADKVCCISVLSAKQASLAKHFGQSNTQDKMHGQQWLKTQSGTSALAESLAYFDCLVDYDVVAGDHKLVVCQVLESVILNAGSPMLYRDTNNMDGSSKFYEKVAD